MRTAILAACFAALAMASAASAEEPATAPKAESELDKTWKTACEWAVGSAAVRVREARAKLIAMGEPALRKAIERLATTEGLELEAAQAVIAGIGAPAAIPLIEAAETDSLPDQVLRESMSLLSQINQKGQMQPEIRQKAEKAVLRNTKSTRLPVRLRALLVSSEFCLREAIPAAAELAKDPAESVRRGVALILGKFGGEEVVEPLVAFLHDRIMTVRFTAQDSLGLIGPKAFPPLIAAIEKEGDPIARRHLLVAMGATGAQGAEDPLRRRCLDAQDPIERGFALRGLLALLETRRNAASKVPEGDERNAAIGILKAEARDFAALAAEDPHPFVQAVRRLLLRTTGAILTPSAETSAPQPAPQESPQPGAPASVIPASAWAAVDEALAMMNMTREDLSFDKTPIKDEFRLSTVQRLLDYPLENFDRCDRIAKDLEAARGDPGRALSALAVLLDVPAANPPALPADPGDALDAYGSLFPELVPDKGGLAALPPGVRRALAWLLRGSAEARKLIEKAFAKLEDVDRATLVKAAPGAFAGSIPDLVYSGAAAAPAEVPEEALFKIALKVDRAALWEAAVVFAAHVAAAEAELAARMDPAVAAPANSPDAPMDGDVLYAQATPWGWVAVGGTGETRYRTDLFLAIDLGGDDRYLGRTAAAAGFCKGRPFASACIDLGGDDSYGSRHALDQGAGLLGVGMLVDRGGDDSYAGTNVVQGAGLFGAGILVDSDGWDRYRGDQFCQAAGAFGVGMLADRGGEWLAEPPVTEVSSNDRYDACRFAQGFGFTHGAGALMDFEGNDVYTAGGKYLHDPLYTDRFQSMSQGFGFGSRPVASGGIGILYDRHGNDLYSAEIYGQGSSYWLALGLLADDRGNDSYTLTHYGQGAGIHLSTGVLLERSGHDSYVTMSGVAQAGPHDLSVGILVDFAGNDRYLCPGVAQGCGWTNAVGILLDLGGNDAYGGNDGQQGWSIQGFSAPARGFPSVGILYDAWGLDRYSVGQDGAIWVVPVGGVGIDRPGGDPAAAKK